MNKIIKLRIFQEKAVFRTSYSMEVIETYPLPPYSTILGFIHNMLSSPSTINGINISVQGKYENLNREFVRYHKYEEGEDEGIFYPIIVTSLVDLELIIHIKMPDIDSHRKLLSSLHNPPYFPYLGRPEDLIIDMEVNEDEENEFDPATTPEGGIEIPYNSYIRFDIAKNLELEGLIYLIPSYYTILVYKEGKRKKEEYSLRNFEIIKVLYVQSGQVLLKKIIVDKEGIPIWWMK